MQYEVEELGPLKKKIAVSMPAADVDAEIGKVANGYRSSIAIPGFRKGKAPLSIVEARFHNDIFKEASESLVERQVRSIVEEMKVEPASRLEYDTPELKKGKDYKFAVTFEVYPEFDLPEYKDFPVEQEKVKVDESEVDALIERTRRDMAELEAVKEARTPQDDDIATITFTGSDKDGKKVAGLHAEGIQISIGDGQVTEGLEALVKRLKPGEEGEDDVTFPEDFPNKEMAGKTFKFKVKLEGIQTRKLPDLNDEFAATLGHYANMDELREFVRKSFMQSREKIAQSLAKQKLLEALLEKVEYPLPESMVERNTGVIQFRMLQELSQGGNAEEAFKDMERLKEKAADEAKKQVKGYIFLTRAAKAEDLSVSEGEIIQELQHIAQRNQRSFEELRDEYIRRNMIGLVHDQILTDKALDAMFAKAKVTLVEPKEEKPEATKAKSSTKKTAKKSADKESSDKVGIEKGE